MLKRSGAGDDFSAVVVQVMYLNGLLMDQGDQIASVSGQTSARWRVLAAADHQPQTVAEAARALGLSRQSVQRVADVLNEDGLLLYRDNPADKRAMQIILTASGKRALSAIQEGQKKWAENHGQELGKTALKQLSQLLSKLQATLEK